MYQFDVEAILFKQPFFLGHPGAAHVAGEGSPRDPRFHLRVSTAWRQRYQSGDDQRRKANFCANFHSSLRFLSRWMAAPYHRTLRAVESRRLDLAHGAGIDSRHLSRGAGEIE